MAGAFTVEQGNQAIEKLRPTDRFGQIGVKAYLFQAGRIATQSHGSEHNQTDLFVSGIFSDFPVRFSTVHVRHNHVGSQRIL